MGGNEKTYFLRILPPPEREPEDPLEELREPEDPLEEPREADEDPVLGVDRVTVPLEVRPADDDLLGAEKDR
jgi:hypothetical protein